jgi:hypothetical protein
VPQDIHSTSHAKNIPTIGESQKVDKPLSPSVKKSTPEILKPPCPGNAKGSTGAKGAPPSPSAADSRRDAAHDLPWPNLTEHSGASSQNSQSYGLRSPGGCQPGEGPSVPRSRKQPRQYLCVIESLWENPEFIQAGYHIG